MDFAPSAAAFIADGCRDRSGGVVGGQIGYRWQANQFVFGLEAQGDWADLSNTRVSLINPAFSTRTKTDGIGLFTGQIGYAWNAALLYLKGGAAVTSNRFSILDTLTGVELASASSTRWGGTVGVGWEYGFAPNWSVGIEYDHLFMGNSNNSFSVVNPILAGALNRISQDVDMVTVRVNYRFGGYGAPSQRVTDLLISSQLKPRHRPGLFAEELNSLPAAAALPHRPFAAFEPHHSDPRV